MPATRPTPWLRRRVIASLVVLVLGAAIFVQSGPSNAAPQPLAFQRSGSDGEARGPQARPAEACSPTGSTAFAARSPLPAGTLSQLGGSAAVDLDVVPASGNRAFLLPGRSYLTLSNERGVVRLAVDAGSCTAPALTRSGDVASGSGTWHVDGSHSQGAFRDATGSGTFTVSAGMSTGAANPWQISVQGTIAVLQPSLDVRIVRSYWGRLGAEYAGRVATVIYRLTNAGPGDAYGARLTSISSPVTGIVPIDFVPVMLGSLNPGQYVDVEVRWRIGSTPRHGPMLTGREFDTVLTVALPDALDVSAVQTPTIHVVAPLFPPAL